MWTKCSLLLLLLIFSTCFVSSITSYNEDCSVFDTILYQGNKGYHGKLLLRRMYNATIRIIFSKPIKSFYSLSIIKPKTLGNSTTFFLPENVPRKKNTFIIVYDVIQLSSGSQSSSSGSKPPYIKSVRINNELFCDERNTTAQSSKQPFIVKDRRKSQQRNQSHVYKIRKMAPRKRKKYIMAKNQPKIKSVNSVRDMWKKFLAKNAARRKQTKRRNTPGLNRSRKPRSGSIPLNNDKKPPERKMDGTRKEQSSLLHHKERENRPSPSRRGSHKENKIRNWINRVGAPGDKRVLRNRFLERLRATVEGEGDDIRKHEHEGDNIRKMHEHEGDNIRKNHEHEGHKIRKYDHRGDKVREKHGHIGDKILKHTNDGDKIRKHTNDQDRIRKHEKIEGGRDRISSSSSVHENIEKLPSHHENDKKIQEENDHGNIGTRDHLEDSKHEKGGKRKERVLRVDSIVHRTREAHEAISKMREKPTQRLSRRHTHDSKRKLFTNQKAFRRQTKRIQARGYKGKNKQRRYRSNIVRKRKIDIKKKRKRTDNRRNIEKKKRKTYKKRYDVYSYLNAKRKRKGLISNRRKKRMRYKGRYPKGRLPQTYKRQLKKWQMRQRKQFGGFVQENNKSGNEQKGKWRKKKKNRIRKMRKKGRKWRKKRSRKSWNTNNYWRKKGRVKEKTRRKRRLKNRSRWKKGKRYKRTGKRYRKKGRPRGRKGSHNLRSNNNNRNRKTKKWNTKGGVVKNKATTPLPVWKTTMKIDFSLMNATQRSPVTTTPVIGKNKTKYDVISSLVTRIFIPVKEIPQIQIITKPVTKKEMTEVPKTTPAVEVTYDLTTSSSTMTWSSGTPTTEEGLTTPFTSGGYPTYDDIYLDEEFRTTTTEPPPTTEDSGTTTDTVTDTDPPPIKTTVKIPTKPSLTKPTRPPCRGKYDYDELIQKSLLFYEAQRSGRLPKKKRISWRGDSGVYDGRDHNVDLSGGFYDGGYHMKVHFPMAASVTLLAWGMIECEEVYRKNGEYINGLNTVKWATDYLMKCSTGDNVFWAQVGDPKFDRKIWTRPEDMTSRNRPSYSINSTNPGSDLAGEVSAALAASSILFRPINTKYSTILLDYSKRLFKFATKYKGFYHKSIPKDTRYKSSGYQDEIAWAAAWLYKATKDRSYLNIAETTVRNHAQLLSRAQDFSWDNKTLGVQILLAKLTSNKTYINPIMQFFDWLHEPRMRRTPNGMIFIRRDGSNRHVANIAFAALIASKYIPSLNYIKFARIQLHLLLGDAGRSFIVGFGNNPPRHPHHVGSSCMIKSTLDGDITSYKCGWKDYKQPFPNPNILFGALVGGPDENGKYHDVRSGKVANRVALDYNAGFQSAVAILADLQMRGYC